MKSKTATFALGCFWQPEDCFRKMPGVTATTVGYSGGTTENPNYENLGDHTETVQIEFDPSFVSYKKLLDKFWQLHDPSVKQTKQYSSFIFTNSEDQAEEANVRQAGEEADPEASYKLLTLLNAETVDKLRKEAIDKLRLAYKYSNKDPDLHRLSAIKQTEVYLQQGQWTKARGIWRKLFELDPSDVEPKRKLLDFYYEAAKVSTRYSRGDISVWKEVRRQSETLVSLEPEGEYEYLSGAHANIELVRMDAEEDAEKWIIRTQALLEKVKELDPTNVELNHLQGQLALLKAMRSDLEADSAIRCTAAVGAT